MDKLGELIFAQVSRLGFGFMLGIGGGGITYLLMSSYSDVKVDPHICMYTGGAIGLGLYRLIEFLFKTVLHPFTSRATLYTRLLELNFHVAMGWVSPSEAKAIRKKLLSKLYFGKDDAADNIFENDSPTP